MSPSRAVRSTRTRLVIAAAAVAGAIVLVVLALNGGPARRSKSARIAITASSCASGWRVAGAGTYAFALANESGRAATVTLSEPGGGVVAAPPANVGAGDTGSVSVRIRAGGVYQWACEVAGEPGTVSKPVQVPWPIATFSGPDTAAPPVQASQLVTPLSDYIGYVDRRLAVLRGQLDTLSAEISSGQRGGAESAWLAAHLTWLQIGQDDGAYGAFGQLGASIDGTAAGLVGGSANPHFTGFHKLEFDLFSRRDLPAAARDASRLKALVGELTPSAVASDLPSTTSGLDNWILRCHEILEDALRDSLSADDDYGSNTDLASITADVTGTREMLGLLAPQIEARAPQLVATASTELTAVDQATAATRSHGRWAGVASLSLLQRQRIDAAVDAALETLAPVSDLMEIGNT